MAQMEQYASSINFADGNPAVRNVYRMPVTIVQVVEKSGGLTFQGTIGESSGGTVYTPIPVVSLRGPEVYGKSESAPGDEGGLFGLLTIGFKSIKVAGSSKGLVDLSSLNADPSFVYNRLSRESLIPHLTALKESSDELLAWLMKHWPVLLGVLDDEQ
jgi:hypothetical protein